MTKLNIKGLLTKQAMEFDDENDYPDILAKDVMVRPTFFYENDSIEKVVKKLKREDCDICIVIDANKHFLGEIKDEHLVKIMADNAINFPLTKMLNVCYMRGFSWNTAKDIAQKSNNIVSEKTPINKILEIIYKKKHQNIIVLNKEKKVTGVITLSSILRFLSGR